MDKIIEPLLQMGPTGIMAAVFIYLYWMKSKENSDLRDKIFEMFKASLEVQHESKDATRDLTRMVQELILKKG